MAKLVLIGCKLPHGITLERPTNPLQTVTLNGKNKIKIIGADYATTEVDGDFWAEWEMLNPEFPAAKSGAIFVAKNSVEMAAMAKDFKDRVTGFEAMATDGKDARALGIKTAEM